jgi:DNA-binding Lrp family transcriptional regulator
MLVVAVRTTEDKRFSEYTQEELLSGEVPVFPSLGTNVRSISDSIGVPRETVRRKVRELIAAGWIDRKGADLRFTALAYQQLAGARVAIEHLAIRNFEVVSELVQKHALHEGETS